MTKQRAKELVEAKGETVLEAHATKDIRGAFEVETESGLFLVTPDGQVRQILAIDDNGNVRPV